MTRSIKVSIALSAMPMMSREPGVAAACDPQ